ncbi:hypothetical protein DYU11_26925 [Fibrisoma montanum]|uniref:Uncharacterized protein n=1 Tax=Fibrisoma montanum TaxID=2305895 RepID=A0A418M0K2_9BACT|nr:hypothetical protein [Fibrisoma montanum]RIV19124.1 hypothetical protein DYU11_26925 [Fibrisoma montanum]
MHNTTYTTIYDLTSQSAISWRSLVLPFGLAVAATVCAYYARSSFSRFGLLGFAIIAVLVAVVIPAWDYYQLSRQKPRMVEGPVADYQEKEWTERYDGKNHHYSYEGFWVNTIAFSYFRNVEMAGFTNTEPVQYPIRDGLPVRIHYIPERQLTDGSVTNRIVKLEVAEPHPTLQSLR